VDDVRTGMKGIGRTVMVGTKLEEFGVEVLGVMRDVSPGRDMVLCRLTGCNLEHAGIVQGMSGSPVYIDGKLLGAVAYGWEFAKDPIAGITPFEQMLQYVRSSDRRVAAEGKDAVKLAEADGPSNPSLLIHEQSLEAATRVPAGLGTVSGGGLGDMRPIATPLAASGFSPRALAFLETQFRPIGMAPMAGGGASPAVLEEEGNKPLVPGSPLSIAMVTGDFDLSGIGTVTHVEGDRVYGFGHPMMSLGECEFPMMNGYIHTVYPRASVSMKMGSPLKTLGVIDTDVSTGVAGRVGRKPDMLPVEVRVKEGRYSDPHTYNVAMVREPNLMPALVMAVLSNAIDTEGNLPEELTAKIKAKIQIEGHDPICLNDTVSGPRYSGVMGPAAMFSPIAAIVNMIGRNPLGKIRIEKIDCDVELMPGRTVASVESVRLASDRIEPGGTLKVFVTLKPFKGDRKTVSLSLPLPDDFPEGAHEAAICDMNMSLRRRFRNEPNLNDPRDQAGFLHTIRVQTSPRRTSLYLHVPGPERGLAIEGQSLPNLPGSARAVFATNRQTPEPPIRSDLVEAVDTPWVVEGAASLKFTVVKDPGLSIK
jgi:hypothetical protein